MEPPKKITKLELSKGNTISTESCETILKYFGKCENKKPYRFLTNTYTQRDRLDKYSHLLYAGLPLNTFRDDFDGQLPEHYFEKFMYKSTFPRVISDMNHIERDDPLTRPMTEKNNYIRKVLNKSKIVKKLGVMEHVTPDVVRCYNQHLKLVGRLEADPDPLFHCHYNWYYAGNGNLHVAELAGDTWLVHGELDVLYVTPFAIDTLKIDYSRSVTFNAETEILEIAISDLHIAVRTKHQVTILKLVLGDQMTIERLGDHESKRPFVSINFDPHHKSILYATTFDNKVHIVNLNFMKKRTVRLTPQDVFVDNWSKVLGVDRTTYAHVTRDTIHIYDKRVNKSVHAIKDLAEYTLLGCDKISAAMGCDNNRLMYVGTSHHLLLLDLRYSSEKAAKPLQRWTHHMTCPPTYISACKFELNKEILCLSSQWYEDTVVLTNDSACFANNLGSSSISLPFRPPTVEDALIEARLKGLCVNIYHPIDKRLYSALTGNAVFQRGAEYLTLTQSSLGDVFCHTLYADHEAREDDSIQRLHEWSQPFRMAPNREFTALKPIAGTWRELRKVPENFTLGATKLNSNVEYKFSEQDLVDIFQGDKIDRGLLDVWLAEPEEELPSLAIERDFSDSD